mmetsp:Transcript_24002/g.56728  ORF Transcript_24002/g.56728 Transcript_24002/m.56728 type:complete len:87 (-) Transcript_24002:266-526(-)
MHIYYHIKWWRIANYGTIWCTGFQLLLHGDDDDDDVDGRRREYRYACCVFGTFRIDVMEMMLIIQKIFKLGKLESIIDQDLIRLET